MSQTDQENAGWAFAFPVMKKDEDPEWRQAYVNEWKGWLERWQPLDEWKQ